MVANIAATNMFGMYPNIYNNQVALNDLSGLDIYYPTGMCLDPALSMSGSIFGGGMCPGMMPGAIPSTMPGMMPYAPSFGGNSYEDYYKQYEKYQDFMIDSSVRQQQKIRNADLRLNAPQEGIQEQAHILNDKIVRNEQDQIKGAYDSFVESVRRLYGDASEEEIRSRANRLYEDAIHKTITEDIREHGRDSFTQGAIQSLTFGIFNNKSAEDTVSDLTGQPVAKEEKAKKIAGNVVGGAVVGGTVLGLGKFALKGLGVAAKSRTFWGIAAGAVAGVIAAIAGSK